MNIQSTINTESFTKLYINCRFNRGLPYMKTLSKVQKLQILWGRCDDWRECFSNPEYESLEELVMDSCRVTDRELEKITLLSKLKMLSLKNNLFGEIGLNYVAKLNCLSELDLSLNNVDETGILIICSKNRQLRILSLQRVKLNWEVLVSISRNLKELKKLNISNCSITYQHHEPNKSQELEQLGNLKWLDASGNELQDLGCRQIIRKCQSINILKLKECYLTDYSVTSIARSLYQLEELTIQHTIWSSRFILERIQISCLQYLIKLQHNLRSLSVIQYNKPLKDHEVSYFTKFEVEKLLRMAKNLQFLSLGQRIPKVMKKNLSEKFQKLTLG